MLLRRRYDRERHEEGEPKEPPDVKAEKPKKGKTKSKGEG